MSTIDTDYPKIYAKKTCCEFRTETDHYQVFCEVERDDLVLTIYGGGTNYKKEYRYSNGDFETQPLLELLTQFMGVTV